MAAATPPQLRLDGQLCFALYAASRAVIKAYGPLLDEIGLTYPQYLTMLVLWERDELSVGELGAQLHLDSGTLTPLLKRLAALQLVVRHRDEADERRVIISLTKRGRALRSPAECIPGAMFSQLGLAPKDAALLLRQLTELTARLADDDSDPA